MARVRPEYYRPPTSIHTRAWRKIRLTVLARDHYTCQLGYPGCTVIATHADHILPLRFGGTNHLANLRAACRSCNLRRGDGTKQVADEPVSIW
jgi:5-methylcytosine-specific restriction endonuclease McrA